jgi:hypothetical protein
MSTLVDLPQRNLGRAVTVTVLRTPSRTAPVKATNRYTLRIPSRPATFAFAKQHWVAGVRHAVLSFAAFGAAAFLAIEIPHTPLLRTRMAIVAIVCLLIGVGLGHLALRNLLGRLRVDARGIRLSPLYCGFSIPWGELYRWELDGHAFRFFVAGAKVPRIVEREYLGAADQTTLREMLVACAAEKELQRPAA